MRTATRRGRDTSRRHRYLRRTACLLGGEMEAPVAELVGIAFRPEEYTERRPAPRVHQREMQIVVLLGDASHRRGQHDGCPLSFHILLGLLSQRPSLPDEPGCDARQAHRGYRPTHRSDCRSARDTRGNRIRAMRRHPRRHRRGLGWCRDPCAGDLGRLFGTLSLIWQIIAFVLSGSRVRVDLLHGATDGISGIASGPPNTFGLDLLVSQGLTQEVVGAKVYNGGRQPVNVDSVDFVFSNGIRASGIQNLGRATSRHRLDGHASQSWHMPARTLRSVVAAVGDSLEVHVEATLGNGKRAKSKDRIRLTA